MATTEVPVKTAQTGVKIMTGQSTTIIVRLASMELLVGGPYVDASGQERTYGHMALRVTTSSTERVYDFGRYAGETGPVGEGRLRVWSSFNAYIKSENSYGRVTTGFTYEIAEEAATRVIEHYQQLISGNPTTKRGASYVEYRLASDYHALTNNCVTMTLSGSRVAMTDLERDAPRHNQGRGMSTIEKFGARAAGWPTRIFMPADAQAMLQANTARPPKQTVTYGK
jgi:hypothetical protein